MNKTVFNISTENGLHEDGMHVLPVCTLCRQRIEGPHILQQGRWYHKHCYLEHFHPVCAICKCLVDGPYYTDLWHNIVCAKHFKSEPQTCDSCSVFLLPDISGESTQYRDGRQICQNCLRETVDNAGQIEEALSEVLLVFNEAGIKGSPSGFSITLCDETQLRQFGDWTNGRRV
ncbi:MAG TPA: hypothetical protein PLR06_13580, partial [Cyclobacteriaceae bacterium]|nr:hypothetical protein [Cyclobacteriaceae bacterium]